MCRMQQLYYLMHAKYIILKYILFVNTKDRVYYISESVMKSATSINKDNLLHCGTCLGKFTKSGKFRLHITALDYLAQYSKVRGYGVLHFLLQCMHITHVHCIQQLTPTIIITVQSLAETLCRNVFPIRKQCIKIRLGTYYRINTTICWRGGI